MTALPLLALLTALVTFLCTSSGTAAACSLRGCYNGGTLQKFGVSLFHECSCRCRPGYAGLDCRYKRIRMPTRRAFQPTLKSALPPSLFNRSPVQKRLAVMLQRLADLEEGLSER